MNSIMATAASGMAASAMWMSAIASNIANARDGSALAAASQTVAPATFQPVTVSLSAQAAGGVQAQIAPTTPATVASYAPSSSDANAQGLVGMPNVDLVSQFANMATATASYRANVAVFKAASKMNETALNIAA
jgi:flagellar basal-body rod protein FlgC